MRPPSTLRRLFFAALATFGSLACGASPSPTGAAHPSSQPPTGATGMGGADGTTPAPPTTTTVPTPHRSGTGGALSGMSRPAPWMAATPVGGRGGMSGAGGTDPLGGHVGATKPLPGWSRGELGVDVAKPRPAPRSTDEDKSLGLFR